LGEELDLGLSGGGTLRSLATLFDRAANAPLDQLIDIGRSLLDRLARDGCRINVTIERETTATRLANSRAQAASIAPRDSGEHGRGRIAGDDVLVVSDAFEGRMSPRTTRWPPWSPRSTGGSITRCASSHRLRVPSRCLTPADCRR